MKFGFPYQILPGLTIHELRKDDKLGRYLAMGRDTNPAPEMWLCRDHVEVGDMCFPLTSIDCYRLD